MNFASIWPAAIAANNSTADVSGAVAASPGDFAGRLAANDQLGLKSMAQANAKPRRTRMRKDMVELLLLWFLLLTSSGSSLPFAVEQLQMPEPGQRRECLRNKSLRQP